MNSGIVDLMKDLGTANLNDSIYMFGGGNPAVIKQTVELVKPVLNRIINDDDLLAQGLQNYCASMGYEPFRETLADLLNQKLNWHIDKDNICVTNGTQQAFHLSFNQILKNSPNPNAKMFLIKTPDYIGYFDTVGIDRFMGSKAKIKELGNGIFRYEIDFEDIINQLEADKGVDEITALAISSPNNPSSHCLNNAEVEQLIDIAKKYNKILIFDHAYGTALPNIIYDEVAKFPFYENTIHFFSFSKFGLAGIRLGFLVANKNFAYQIGIQNSIQTLAPSTFNAILANELIKNTDIDDYMQNTLMPIYLAKRKLAISIIQEQTKNLPMLMHKSQGGFFLWLFCKNLKLSSREVYLHLKEKKLMIIPGEYFFFEQPDECFLRLSYTPKEEKLQEGLPLFTRELHRLYDQYGK